MRNDLSQRLEVGTILTLEHGEYSDREWTGPFRVIKSFVKQEAVDAYKAWWRMEGRDVEDLSFYDGRSQFAPFLVLAGFVEAVDNATEWFIGSYGFEP